MPKKTLLFVGIGNVGKEYNFTRHNVGFWLIDELFRKFSNNLNYSEKFNSSYSKLNICENNIYIVKPKTFVNLSGTSLKDWKHFYKIDNNDIFIFYDDISTPLGSIKIKNSGSSGGHNGIKSITNYIGENYNRIKIGLKPEQKQSGNTKDSINNASSFVLGSMSRNEKEIISQQIEVIINNIELLLDRTNTSKAIIVEKATIIPK